LTQRLGRDYDRMIGESRQILKTRAVARRAILKAETMERLHSLGYVGDF